MKHGGANLNENGHVIWCPCVKCDVLREVKAVLVKYFILCFQERDDELIYGKGVELPTGIFNNTPLSQERKHD
jgi:hypothetical protein